MKSNNITKMITMCMCLIVVGFASQKGQQPIEIKGLSQISYFGGYHGSYAEEPSQQVQTGSPY